MVILVHFCCWNYPKHIFSHLHAETNLPTLTYEWQKNQSNFRTQFSVNTVLHINCFRPFSGNFLFTSFFWALDNANS